MFKKKFFVYSLLTLVIAVILGITGASVYLYYFAFEPQKPLNSGMASKKKIRLKRDKKWLAETKQQLWTEESAGQNLKLKAAYLPAARATDKTIIVAHGYQEDHMQMASYMRMFHKMGYNVLAPDDRGAGKSQVSTSDSAGLIDLIMLNGLGRLSAKMEFVLKLVCSVLAWVEPQS
ncbi:alpha/beta hydrolases domain [Liquorilactobacillus sucicola DSM 21376 = JCM 15457]|nr:alpha/beta hydrolases domain [Liquorilactobacillus sucicola DSM 21376 = JCM 15457]